jgi:hypothetical protein
MLLEPLIKGLVLGVFLAISVGPVIFAILKQSINNGHKAGYVFVAGISASDIFLVVICNLFSSLFTAIINHKTAIAVAGSIFLVGFGIYTLFFKKVKVDEGNNLIQKQFRTHHFCFRVPDQYTEPGCIPVLVCVDGSHTHRFANYSEPPAIPVDRIRHLFALCIIDRYTESSIGRKASFQAYTQDPAYHQQDLRPDTDRFWYCIGLGYPGLWR